MRARIWIFTVVVAVALALNLARVSLSIAQTGEDTMRARVAAASNALRGQLDLLDARLAPRAVAMMPDLIEAVRGGDGQSPARPDERALRVPGGGAGAASRGGAGRPGPGCGGLQVRLPFVGTNLSGGLPRGASHYAVRGALLPLDGGVQAALTVPASPYLAWLGRYQAFYAAGLAVFLLFGLIWGLVARAPAPVVQQVFTPPPAPFEPEDGVVSPPRRAPRMPPLAGTDFGEARSAPAPARDMPRSKGEDPSREQAVPVAVPA